MTQGGRPRRSEEQPDSAFGKALKKHIRSVEGFTQAELARESLVPEKTISQMVKGKRESGYELRNHLRAIITVLHQKKALLTLDEANALMRTIPAISILDERDPDDKKIIDLFDTTATEVEQVADQGGEDSASPNAQVSSGSPDDVSVSNTAPVMTNTSPFTTPSPVAAPIVPPRRRAKKLAWYVSSGVVFIVILGIILAITHQDMTHQSVSKQTNSCSAPINGVTLYTDTNYRGQCHTFSPGDYELAQYGLEQNVSSIKDSNNAYFIKLFDKGKNFYNLDKSMPILPAEWDKRADMLHIEKHRPTSCHPGNNGIIAFINTDYAGGCLFITDNIPDLTPLNFDSDIVSIQFLGSYQNTHQLVIYKQPNYKEECGTYRQNQSDLEQCARIALSVQVLPSTPSNIHNRSSNASMYGHNSFHPFPTTRAWA